jgi:hypothetical protein
MNLLMILCIMFLAPPIRTQKELRITSALTSNKLVKSAKNTPEGHNVYYYAPTNWIKTSKKI